MPASPHRSLSRRSVLVGGAALTVLVACGKDSDDGSSSASQLSLEPTDEGARVLIANFAYGGNYLVSGVPQRLPFLIGAGGAPTTDAPGELRMQLSFEGRDVGDALVVPAHRDGIPLPYFPLTTTFDRPGLWTVTTELDGAPATQAVQVSEPGEVALVQPGQAMRLFDTPTLDDARGVDPICTADPVCPLHTQTLTAALAAGGPIAFLVGTPAYCRTGLCGPVLELLVEARSAHPDMQFVHAEVYKDAAAKGGPQSAQLTPVIDAYGLSFEPSLFVADATGRIGTRLDNVYDRAELDAALAGVR